MGLAEILGVIARLPSKPSRLFHSFTRLLVRGPGRPPYNEQNYVRENETGIKLIYNNMVNHVGGWLGQDVLFELYTKMEKPQGWQQSQKENRVKSH